MSFEKITYTYQPPPTITPAPPSVAAAAAAAVTANQSSRSLASSLVSRLDDLRTTAQYLESLILARTAGTGITFDLASDPDLALALSRIYGSAPGAVSVSMYNHLLDAEAGIERVEMVLKGSSAAVEVSPVQKLDLRRITKLFDDSVSSAGNFRSNLTGFLRVLKGDRIIFDHLQAGLKDYPAAVAQAGNSSNASGIPVQTLTSIGSAAAPPASYPQPGSAQITGALLPADLNADTSVNMNERLDAVATVYAGIYNLTARTDDVYSDIQSIASQYIEQPLAELLGVVTMLQALVATFHQIKLKDLRSAMVAFVFPRLAAELGLVRFAVDRLIQKAVSPVSNMLKSFGRLFAEVQHAENEAAFLIQGGFTGMVKAAATGNRQAVTPARQNALQKIPGGLASLTGHLSWSLQSVQRHADFLEQSMMRALDRKLGHTGDSIEVMQSLRAIEALVDITKSFSSALKSGTLSPQNVPAPNSSLGSFSQVVSTLKAGGDTTFLIQGSQIVPVPPALPSPPPAALAVLNQGGAGLLSSSQLSGA